MNLQSTSLRAILGYALIVVLVVIAANAGLYPGVGQAFPGQPWTAHPYRVAMAATLAVLAIMLGIIAASAGREIGSRIAGLTALLVGGILTGLALAAAPWTLFPGDQYPVSFLWVMLGAPTGLAAWLLASALWPSPSQHA